MRCPHTRPQTCWSCSEVHRIFGCHARSRPSPGSDGSACAWHPHSRGSVAVKILTVLLGPARILVFLPVFRGVLLPLLWCLAGLHGLILFAAITLLGNRHDRGIHHLAATGNVALRLQMPAKALEQLLDQPGFYQRLTEQPQRRAVGNAILNAKPQKPRE